MDDKQKEIIYNDIISKIKNSFDSQEYETPHDVYKTVINELASIPYYDWTGIYLVAGEELILEYYIGEKTEHTHIPIGKGVCGSAVAEKTDKIIHDVREESNYLACSLKTRSEIVVLIEIDDQIIGQIDVDSDQVGAFTTLDQLYLQKITGMIIQKFREIEQKFK
jgi:GAF domain-containing protein